MSQMTNFKTDPDQDSGDGGDGRQDHIRHLEQSADKCRGYYWGGLPKYLPGAAIR